MAPKFYFCALVFCNDTYVCYHIAWIFVQEKEIKEPSASTLVSVNFPGTTPQSVEYLEIELASDATSAPELNQLLLHACCK